MKNSLTIIISLTYPSTRKREEACFLSWNVMHVHSMCPVVQKRICSFVRLEMLDWFCTTYDFFFLCCIHVQSFCIWKAVTPIKWIRSLFFFFFHKRSLTFSIGSMQLSAQSCVLFVCLFFIWLCLQHATQSIIRSAWQPAFGYLVTFPHNFFCSFLGESSTFKKLWCIILWCTPCCSQLDI